MKSREIGDYGVLHGLQMSQEYDKKIPVYPASMKKILQLYSWVKEFVTVRRIQHPVPDIYTFTLWTFYFDVLLFITLF